MSTSPEMRVFKLTVKKGLLDCIYCRRPLHPNTLYATPFKCDGSHIFCSGCRMRHDATCVSHSVLLDEIISKLKFKYDCCDSGRKYIPYHELAEHLCDDVRDRHNAIRPFPFRAWGECILDTSALVCSECRLPLRPPIFRHVSRGSRVCSACYRGDITNYLHCSELDYLVEGISVECEACKQNLPFLALASHRLDDCPLKHKLQKIAPGSSIRENLCDEEETERPVIHGKNKRKRPLEAGKMDKHDDDSCDDNHACVRMYSGVRMVLMTKWMNGMKLEILRLRLSKVWLRMPLRHLVRKQRLQCHMSRKQHILQPRAERQEVDACPPKKLLRSHLYHCSYLVAQTPVAGKGRS
ncbi:hypothetical protein BS78_K258700 [Paspalum vaginatum]|uniref:Uncharacterized protein n=1 Tax=Paspalum vaginatum TaxID=158149 RepID=A0A9W7X8L7_9POAL|nr:hypothetical protein BS78_K258700 [Paspalum vaginatum]